MANEKEMKELFSVLKVLSEPDKKKAPLRYVKGLEDYSQIQLKHYDGDAVARKLVSKDFTVTDWHILYALLVMKIADTLSICNFLYGIQKHNSGLYLSTDYSFVSKRINQLFRSGMIGKLQFIQNAEQSMDLAYELLEKAMADTEKKKAALIAEMNKEDDCIDLTTEFRDFDDEELYAEWDTSYLDDIRKKNALFAYNEKENSLYGGGYRKYFGKESQLINGYFLNDLIVPVICSHFGKAPVTPVRFVYTKMFYTQLGIMSAAKLTAGLYGLKSFHSTKQASVTYKRGQVKDSFYCLSESEFRLSIRENPFPIYVAVFASYMYCDERTMMPSVEKKNSYDLINSIRNYIGLKAIGKEDRQDALCIVLVNDVDDLNNFVVSAKRYGLTENERKRIFITSDSIIEVFGIRKFIQFDKIVDGKPSYSISSLPIVTDSEEK